MDFTHRQTKLKFCNFGKCCCVAEIGPACCASVHVELSCWLVKKNLQPALTAFLISMGKTSKAAAQQVAAPKTKAAKAEAIKDDPASMRRSISRMLTSLKYKADPTKNKKKKALKMHRKYWQLLSSIMF